MRAHFIGAAIAATLLASCAPSGPTVAAPSAVAGVLDLRQYDFQKDGNVELKGEWDFRWQEFAAPGRPGQTRAADRRGWSSLQMPESWTDSVFLGRELPAFGYATFRLRILLPPGLEPSVPLALWQHSFSTALALYVDGARVGTLGTVGRSEATHRPKLASVVFPAVPLHREMELTYHVSNFSYKKGGLWGGVTLGPSAEIGAARERSLFIDFALAGSLFLAGIYHLMLFFQRKRDRPALFFGLFCLIIALRALSIGEYSLAMLLPSVGWTLHIALAFLTFYLAVPCFAAFLATLFPVRSAYVFLWVTAVIAAAFSLHVLFADAATYTGYVDAFQICTIVLIPWALILLGQAIYQRREGALVSLGGIGVLFACVVLDITDASRILALPQTTPLGVFLFTYTQALVLARQNARAHTAAEELSALLETSNEELRRLDNLKDEFLANTSHELRTPLHGIIGIVESLVDGAAGKVSPILLGNLTLVSASARRLANLVNDILDFAKLRHADIILIRRTVDVRAVADMAMAISRPLIGGKDLVLLPDFAPDLPPALADEERVAQVFHNLLGNAIKFTKAGTITVRLRAEGDWILASVVDTGIGVPPEKRGLIFESFVQADGTVSREYGGTGLGLSISKRLVEAHGGTITVDSAPGHGSSFTFSLPVTQSQSDHEPTLPAWPEEQHPIRAAVPAKGASADVQPGAAAGQKRAATTLIVDDDPVNLQVLRNQLSLHNHEVVEATNGRDALRLLGEQDFDLVLLDVMMPGLSGYEVCSILRQHHSETQLPVIMLTAKNQIEDIVAGLESGANDYLAKPFDARELLARVGIMLKLKHAAESQSHLEALRGEMELAREIQQSLLPERLPLVSGLTVASRYRSMARVGGDYYDMQSGSGGVGAIVADVCGHGVPAALIVSIVKMAYWFEHKHLQRPDQLLHGMNTILNGNVGESFVTACAVFVDLAGRKILTANAGHPPLLLWKARDRTIVALRPAGKILGVLAEVPFEMSQAPLEPGDRILLYTDGLFEAPNEQLECYGEARLEDFIRAHAHLDAAAFADELMAVVTAWSGGEDRLDDDIALVVMDVSEADSPHRKA